MFLSEKTMEYGTSCYMMRQFKDRTPRFIYITGADGTGKSTQAQLLIHHLEGLGIRCHHLWLRFPFFFSFPLLAYARWRGYSWHEVNEEVDHGYWSFSHSLVMRKLFPWVLLFDASLAALGKIYLPLFFGATIVCERFVLDMLVDLSVALQDPYLSFHLPGRLFLRLMPDNAKIIILDLDKSTLCDRRHDLVFDHTLASRLETYHLLAIRLGLPIIDCHLAKSLVLRKILTTMDLA